MFPKRRTSLRRLVRNMNSQHLGIVGVNLAGYTSLSTDNIVLDDSLLNRRKGVFGRQTCSGCPISRARACRLFSILAGICRTQVVRHRRRTWIVLGLVTAIVLASLCYHYRPSISVEVRQELVGPTEEADLLLGKAAAGFDPAGSAESGKPGYQIKTMQGYSILVEAISHKRADVVRWLL